MLFNSKIFLKEQARIHRDIPGEGEIKENSHSTNRNIRFPVEKFIVFQISPGY